MPDHGYVSVMYYNFKGEFFVPMTKKDLPANLVVVAPPGAATDAATLSSEDVDDAEANVTEADDAAAVAAAAVLQAFALAQTQATQPLVMPRINSDPCPPASMLDPMPQEQIFELENWIQENQQETMYQALQKHVTGVSHDLGTFPDLMPVQRQDRYKGRLWLLPGSHEMHKFDTTLKQQQSTSLAPMVYGKVGQLIKGLAEKYKADFVIVDASPSNDEINKVIGVSCDYIQPTIIPDFYNWASIKRDYCARWAPEYLPHHREYGFVLKTTPPRILPALAAAYHMNEYRTFGKMIDWSQANFISCTNTTFSNPRVPQAVRDLLIKDVDGRHVVPVIKRLQFIIMSQELATPIFALSPNQIKKWTKMRGHAAGLAEEVKYAKPIFAELATWYAYLLGHRKAQLPPDHAEPSGRPKRQAAKTSSTAGAVRKRAGRKSRK